MADTPELEDCFVIMPISDPAGYAPGHFQRVYKHAIAPAVARAGYQSIRADDVNNTNFIVVDLLQRIINTPLAICDLSAKNPNVFFELGIRQAFDMPVVLVKDSQTERVFDIQGIRTLEYDASLRVDTVAEFQEKLASAIAETMAAASDSINSLVRLLNLQPAKLEQPPQLSQDTALLLSAIRDIYSRIDSLNASRRAPEVAPLSGISRPMLLARVPEPLFETLTEISERESISRSSLAGQAIEKYIASHDASHLKSLKPLDPSERSSRMN